MAIDSERVQSLFLAAVDLPQTARERFLDQQCGENTELRERVLELIGSHEQTGSFMDHKPDWKIEATDSVANELVGEQIGPYKLREKIGEGGMGVVFVAEQEKPIRRKVALKVIKPGMDSKAVLARFEAEQQALALMNHRNIAKVLDAGLTETRRPYFVMDLVHGIPITEYCDQKQMSVQERLELFVQVCRAIQHAHQKGIIHRDIKPSNILVTEEDGLPIPKIIDFGVAKAVSQKLTDRTVYTNFRSLLGTPLYASPEQAALSNTDVDTRSDVYSLGVLLYELITGSTPFDREQLQTVAYDEMCRIIREQEPPKPSTKISTLADSATGISKSRNTEPAKLVQAVRGDLDWIVMKALEKDRGRRYEAASSLADDILKSLNNDVISARPPSMIYQLGKVVRRNRLVVGFVATVLVTLFCGLSIGLIGQYHQKKALAESVTALEQADGRLKELLAEYEKDLTNQALLTAMNGQVKEAIALSNRLNTVTSSLGGTPTSVANKHFIEGVAMFFGGNESVAHSRLKAALDEEPDNLGILAMVALSSWFVQSNLDYEGAMLKLKQAGNSNDPYATLFYSFAEIYRDPANAMDINNVAGEALNSTIGKAIRCGIYGHMALHDGNKDFFDECWKCSEEAFREAPHNAFVTLIRAFGCQNGMIVFHDDAERYAEFLDMAKIAVRRLESEHSDYQMGRFLRAAHFMQIGDRDQAAREYLQLAKEGRWFHELGPVVFETPHNQELLALFKSYENGKPERSRLITAYQIYESDRRRALELCWKEFDVFPSLLCAKEVANAFLFFGELDEAKRLARHALNSTEVKPISRPFVRARECLQFIVDGNVEAFEGSLADIRMKEARLNTLEFQQGMVAFASGRKKDAKRLLGSAITRERWPDDWHHLWAKHILKRWETNPDWMPRKK